MELKCRHAGNKMTDAEVERKFNGQVVPKYGMERTKTILDGLWRMDHLVKAAGTMVRWFDGPKL